MRTEQLEYVVAVTRHGSFRRAAEQMHVSIPALSEAVAKLERELGVPLLERHPSGARISPAGHELLPPIGEVIEAVARLRAAAAGRRATRVTPRIGTVNAATATVVVPALRAFQAQHPGSAVEMHSLRQDEIEAGLATGALEVGLVNLLDGDEPRPGLEPTVLLTGRPVAVMAATHPLAARTTLTADDLRRDRFVAMRPSYAMHRAAQRLFGADPPPEWHAVDGAEMGKALVAGGGGVALLPDFSVEGDPLERAGLLVTRPVVGDLPGVTLVSLHRGPGRTSAVVADLLAHLHAHARREAERRGDRAPGRTIPAGGADRLSPSTPR